MLRRFCQNEVRSVVTRASRCGTVQTQQCLYLEQHHHHHHQQVIPTQQHRQLHIISSTQAPAINQHHDNIRQQPLAFKLTFPAVSGSRRQMGIRTKAKNRARNTKPKKKPEPLKNDELIRHMLQRTKKSAEEMEVRIIIERGTDQPPDVKNVTLTEAIGISCDEGMDLIGVNVHMNPPIIKCMEYGKFVFQITQSRKAKKAKSNQANSAGGNKRTKQFTFKSGIDDHDLERKVNNMVSYLEKGHSSQVFLTSNRRGLAQDKNIINSTLTRIQEIVGDSGSPQGEVRLNELGNRGTVLFQPNSKRQNRNA